MAFSDSLDDEDDDNDNDNDEIRRTYLVFAVGNDSYAIGVSFVTEVVRLQRIYAIPDVPDYVRGVINLRGRVLPLVDMRRRIQLAVLPYTDRTLTIVLASEDNVMTGLVVDSVEDALEIPETAMEAVTARMQSRVAGLVSSVAKVDDRVLLILNPSAFLAESFIHHSPTPHLPRAIDHVAESTTPTREQHTSR